MSACLKSRREREIDRAWALRNATPIQKKKFSRNRLAEAQNWRCCYCGVRMNEDASAHWPTIEHVLPKSLGGSDDTDNLVIACQVCNERRADQIWPRHIEALRIAGIELPVWDADAATWRCAP